MPIGEMNRIFPKSGRQVLDGGLNNKYERSIIADNESPDCLNVSFNNGAVETRQGFTKLNGSAIASAAVDGFYVRRANTNAETMIVACNGSFFTLVGSTFVSIPSSTSLFTAGARVGASQMENHIFFGNGGAIPYKWNGTNFTRHGVYPPTTTATVATGAVGNPNGGYQYKVTMVNSQSVESDVGPACSTITVANTKITVSAIPVAPTSHGVSARRLYRTAAGGTTFKRVTEISDNTTTTYTDDTADASLGATAPTDNGVPPKYSTIVYHQSRLFMNDSVNPSYIWYTNLGEPYTVGSLNFQVVGDDSTDLVKGLTVYQNSLFITCEKSAWLLYMSDTDPTSWQLVRVDSAYGSKSPFGFVNYNNKVLFPAVENGKFVGMAALAGSAVEQNVTFLSVLSAGSDLKSDRIEPDMFNVQETYLPNISAITFKSKAFISVTYGAGQTKNNRIYVMDYSISNLSKQQREAWVPWTGTALYPAQFAIYDGKLYFATADATGFVYQLEAGTYNDDSQAINSYFWTKEFSGYDQDVNFHKDFRYVNLLLEKTGAYYMDVFHRVDSDDSGGSSQQVSLDPGGSQWGVMVWGVDVWGGGVAQENFTLDLGTAAGKRLQLKFSNQNVLNQRFKIHYMNFTYNVKGQR